MSIRLDLKKSYSDYISPIKIKNDFTGFSPTSLVEFSHSPMHFQAYLNKEKKVTPDMELGTALHKAILEPNEFDKYYVIPEKDYKLNTNVGKEYYQSLELKAKILSEENNIPIEKIKILRFDDVQMIKNIQDHLLSNQILFELIHNQNTIREQLMRVKDPETDLNCNFVSDFHNRVDGYAGDFKFVAAKKASPELFQKMSKEDKNHIKAAMYLDFLTQHYIQSGIHPEEINLEVFWFIPVEKEYPYAYEIYEVSPKALNLGRLEYIFYKNEIKKCQMRNEWNYYRYLNTYADSKELTMNLDLPRYYNTPIRFQESQSVEFI